MRANAVKTSPTMRIMAASRVAALLSARNLEMDHKLAARFLGAGVFAGECEKE